LSKKFSCSIIERSWKVNASCAKRIPKESEAAVFNDSALISPTRLRLAKRSVSAKASAVISLRHLVLNIREVPLWTLFQTRQPSKRPYHTQEKLDLKQQ